MPAVPIPVDNTLNTHQFGPILFEMGFEDNQVIEILRCYDVLRVWREKFDHLGTLVSLDHLSGEDDPPDIRAHFSSGTTLDMEHTSVEPSHRHWAEKLRGNQGGFIPPASGVYKLKGELLESMNPYGGGIWAATDKEMGAHHDLILEAVRKKIEKHPPGGVLVLDGDCHQNDYDLPAAIRLAFEKVRVLPGANKWTYSFISRHDYKTFYSVIFGPTIDYEVKRTLPE